VTVFGGKIIKVAGGAIFKRLLCNPFTAKWLGKACFVKGTLIHTKEGLVPIEEIKAGDEVLSYNQDTKQTEYKSVIETYVRQTESIVKLEIEGEAKVIETTPEHPFYVRIHKARDALASGDDGEWKAAASLQIGDKVLSASGEWKRIVNYEQQARDEQVYNFAVEDNHNYFVGQSRILVHNTYKIALGLEEGLDNFAKGVGGETWKQWGKNSPWKDKFLELMNNPNTKALFNLDGVDVWGGVQRAARGAGGATDWELLMIRQNPQWGNQLTFMLNGVKVGNPFF
jgi:hypothetical protein